MSEAVLTNGAFYPHFVSKEVLVREALVSALTDQSASLERDGAANCGIEGIIRNYLIVAHLEGTEDGCPSAALLPEIGRQLDSTRRAYEVELGNYIETFASYLPPSSSSSSRERAMAIFGLMVGILQIARAVSNEIVAAQILEGCVQAALLLAKT
jgi:TetR/AcrR family transcriptional repressor of nem operon